MRVRLVILGLMMFSVGRALLGEPADCLAQSSATETLSTIQPTEVNLAPTALDKYVQQPDDSYRWELKSRQRQANCDVSVLDFVSQTWRQADEVNRVTWQHWLTIVKPDTATSDTAMLFITGGANGRDAPGSAPGELMMVAQAAGVVIAELKMVPNQPLIFHGDGVNRVEDDLIGYTWDQYLKTGDDTWPAQLPMTKSAVRAMDAVQEFLASEQGGEVPIKDFVVSGASKRGWTTWLTGAMDKRVAAIAPIVIDVLNVNVSMQHHYSAYGFWAPAINDYVYHQIPHRRFQPEQRALLQIVDPFAYRDRLTMPKCIINATGDQFFLPDSSQFYFAALEGDKQLCYVPNSEHSLRGTNALETLASFTQSIAYDLPRPQVTWEFIDDQTMVARADQTPSQVVLWQATNLKTRDFRVDTIGRAYQQSPVEADAEGNYRVEIELPEQGWRAAFLEFTFDIGASTPMRITTPVRVAPTALPFADQQAPVIAAEEQ